jgi:hypothetical protein
MTSNDTSTVKGKIRVNEEQLAEAIYFSGDDPYWPTWAALLGSAQLGNHAAEMTLSLNRREARKIIAYVKGKKK